MNNEKIDLKKKWKNLYAPSAKEVSFVDVPSQNFLCIDGHGDPNKVPEFAQAIEALYSVSYTLKFQIKKGPLGIDYGVMPLEGLWWADDMSAFDFGLKDNWHWTLMILQPEWVTEVMAKQAIESVFSQKDIAKVKELRFEAFTEGPSAQLLHIGPFDTEGPNIQRIHQEIEKKGMVRTGKHHEIYLTDMRKADPAKWKTILRQPMEE